ncbi:hypothetical protein ACPOL_0415 [Acidisarcina polymorpha]|uniref:Uncharacterized protein n=1 Tax=Acidisarcina polymorpha TaxID=2211140 RepID=A0A2Z5FSQ3_9BACT|nr:hypothetical protein [Acidisarcina polymorpha]AXC09792.1 hypothetical protein ACPOL_0415 [Acidisarcina polymorpha]
MNRLLSVRSYLLCAVILPAGLSGILDAQQASADPAQAAGIPGAYMGRMGHMHMTTQRPVQAGDQAKADAVAADAKAAMAHYVDYRKALADGYQIFLPDVPQPQYHFTNYEYGREAWSHFDPTKPTSLLYKKTPDGGYKLIGAMYTDRVDATEDELNERIPLSIAQWHQHINFCKAPPDHKSEYFGPRAKFGLEGSITTKDACDAAGGEFHPHFFGWMVHVYPFETDPKKVWSIDDDDQGHDNMDHSAMPGMKIN